MKIVEIEVAADVKPVRILCRTPYSKEPAFLTITEVEKREDVKIKIIKHDDAKTVLDYTNKSALNKKNDV